MIRKAAMVPYSSVVGASIQVTDHRGTVAIIMISVPQPSLDYKEVALPLAQEIADALNKAAAAKPSAFDTLPDDYEAPHG